MTINFQHLSEHRTAFPPYSFLGSAAEAALLPPEHQSQIHFLDAHGSRLVAESLSASGMLREAAGPDHSWPFHLDCFKQLETHPYETPTGLKKWLYERGIPFRHEVLLHSGTSNQDVLLTWKMVIKYAERIFRAHDWLVVDATLYWALFYHPGGSFTFGRDRPFDPEEEYQQMYLQQELRGRYPFLKFPY